MTDKPLNLNPKSIIRLGELECQEILKSGIYLVNAIHGVIIKLTDRDTLSYAMGAGQGNIAVKYSQRLV